ncbi:shugoshin 2-like isoform X2 [Carassius carassius]|uniref:shugoshin 2-like isoform X2 n=1 Tax=Carassius carassius TaxID=217509 RepID=UPI0028695EB1|nr:shugoshin 2-like isoform X2 [Carassius carassius]
MHFNKYKDKHNQQSSLSSSFITEKKENIRMDKQTASVYAAKIKTKIHNTSSFFKLSLKSNNKALALALVAQKQKSRELEAEVVRLRKEAQTTNFDLAQQRHRNKQLFANIREFYDSSLNWMTKAVDIFCNEEDPDSEHNTSEDQMIEIEKEVGSLQGKPLCPRQDYENSEPVNTAVDDPSQESDSPAQQNTIYDSEMEVSISDSSAEIVTVETNARKTSRVTEEHQENKDLCLSEKGSEVISAKVDSPVEFSRLDNTSAVSKETAAMTPQCSLTVQNEVENGQQTESITARRKTHVTSRCTKSRRRTCKRKEPNPDPRKTHVISQDPPNYTFKDCFSDLELQNSERNKAIENTSSKAVKNKAKESHATQEPRRTFIVQDELRPQKSRKTKVLSLMMDQSLSDVHETVQSASTLCLESACTDVHIVETAVQKHKNKTATHPLSQSEKCETQKNRGIFMIQASQLLISRNSFLNETNKLEDPNRPEGLQEVISETQTTPFDINSDNVAQQHKEPEHDFHKILTENTSHPECSQEANTSLVQKLSELTPSVTGKAKKQRNEGKDKIKKKKAVSREKPKALAKKQNSRAVSMDENVLTGRQYMNDLQNGAGGSSLSNTLQLPVISHYSVSEEGFRDERNAETLGISSATSVDKLDQDDHINMDSFSINLDQTNQALEGRCRKTYVVSSSHKSLIKEKTDSGASSDISEHDLFTNEMDNVSSVMNRTMFVVEKFNVTSNGFSGHTNNLQFTEERPPCETLDGYTETLSDESSAHSPQPKTHCQTMNICQDQDSDLRHQAPEEGRVMKSLTNTEHNTDFGKKSRRAAPVSYKEPALNCKMRRGDKYSDTKLLNSPVFKDKKKKK